MITSVQNPLVKSTTKLHQKKYRDQMSSYLVIGEHELIEALKHGEARQLFSLDDTYQTVSPHVMKKMTGGIQARVLGVFEKPKPKALKEKVLVCENLQDPGNMGTLMRSAVGFGFNDVICIGGVDPYHPKVISSSEGYFSHLNILGLKFEDAVRVLDGYHHVLTQPGSVKHSIPQKPLALWLGNEGQGLTQDALRLKGTSWGIQTGNIESLNVAVAGSIIMHALKDV